MFTCFQYNITHLTICINSLLADDKTEKQIEQMVTKKMFNTTYNWQPIQYDHYKCMAYLVGRSAQEYSIIYRIFSEIVQRKPDFIPRSYFDFGSGVGTSVWAASNVWNNSIFEYYLVDASKEMNELSDLILRDGVDNKESSLKNVFHRQFMPATIRVSNMVIVCIFVN